MDARFHPAVAAIRDGDLARLTSLLQHDPSLATARSSVSHPTLLQCLVLDAIDAPHAAPMAKALIERGADIHEPLKAAAGVDNVEMVELLLDAGASIDGDEQWSPLQEALYWGQQRTIRLLMSRGAAIKNLRTAAGLGRTDLIARYFNDDGSLRPEAGSVQSPFPRLTSREPQAIIDNAFVYACMHNHIDTAALLLEKGAAIDAIPAGFDYAGTGLHYAAFFGHRAMVEFLLNRGADRTIKDPKVNSTPAGWAEHRGFTELQALLNTRQ